MYISSLSILYTKHVSSSMTLRFATTNAIFRVPFTKPKQCLTRSMSSVSSKINVTLLMRSDHSLFSGTNGNTLLKNLTESYKFAMKNKCLVKNDSNSHSKNRNTFIPHTRMSIPFYLPHVTVLCDEQYANCSGDVNIESCFALHIDTPNVFVNATDPCLDSITDNSKKVAVFRSFINTHIIYAGKSALQYDILSFIQGENSKVLPQRIILNELYFSNKFSVKLPFQFNVDVASDKELGIDSEWEKLQQWSKTV